MRTSLLSGALVCAARRAACNHQEPGCEPGAEQDDFGLLQAVARQAQPRLDLEERVADNEDQEKSEARGDCSQQCSELSEVGRWNFGPHGHNCEDPITGGSYCYCSHEQDSAAACATGRSNKAAARAASGGKGSPEKTIMTFCNSTALLAMHGVGGSLADGEEESEDDSPSVLNQLESSILADVAKEMKSNNVDQIARELFSFYVCVRWVPDAVFWRLARQELAADLLAPVEDGEGLDQAVAQLYQYYKFVPLLCSKNLEVFSETDEEDHTYFRRFKKDVTALSQWLHSHSRDEVATDLVKADEIFCGEGKPMNDATCLQGQRFAGWARGTAGWAGGLWDVLGVEADTEEEKWRQMATVFQSFDARGDDAFHTGVKEWKSKFPFHSFVHRQAGMPSGAPGPSERFLVCFGKRVASQMHRRPAGQHIMADQNNMGCHGFWDTKTVGDMLQRMVDLWRPPTCQMADMTYEMKQQILSMYSQMNKNLFDALPNMLADEKLAEDGQLDAAIAGPSPFDPQILQQDGVTFVDGMRVRASRGMKYPRLCKDGGVMDQVGSWWSGQEASTPDCFHISAGDYGFLKVSGGELSVQWDHKSSELLRLEDCACDEAACSGRALAFVPEDYGRPPSTFQRASDLVAGFGGAIGYGLKLFTDMFFKDKYTSMATLMSNSTSKWAVCPINGDANLTILDSHLGVEDAALQDFQQKAYAKLMGTRGKLPGESCTTPDFLPLENYPGGRVCEISELHADHLEKYTMDNGSLEQFLCPARPSLEAPKQLALLKKVHTDSGQCLLHMTQEHLQHYQWLFSGNHLARRQYDRKSNAPSVEYELIKLDHVPGSGKVSYARTCGPDQKVRSPRFCSPIQMHSQWPNVQEVANLLADAASGSVAMGASAISDGLAAASTLTSGVGNLSDVAGDALTHLGESTWDALTGAGRLLWSVGESAISKLSDGVPGGRERDQRLEAEIFQESDAKLLLHSLSFQRSIGANGKTSNAKERYQRYVMTLPCPGFNPAVEFAVRKKWRSVALRMIQEQSGSTGRARALLAIPSVQIAVRGEGRLFLGRNQKAKDKTWFKYGASVRTLTDAKGSQQLDGAKISCEWSWWNSRCEPVGECRLDGNHVTGKCIQRACGADKWKPWGDPGEACAAWAKNSEWGALKGGHSLSSTCSKQWAQENCADTCCEVTQAHKAANSWAVVGDGQLQEVVAPIFSAGGNSIGSLRGLVLTLYCGPKEAFTDAQPRPSSEPSSLQACLEAGVKTNAELRARYPWKLHIPKEVVAMAVFSEHGPRLCSSGASKEAAAQLCGAGAQKASGLDSHLGSGEKSSNDGDYQGLATGSGFPSGTPKEVWMRPEDVLEAAGLLSRAGA